MKNTTISFLSIVLLILIVQTGAKQFARRLDEENDVEIDVTEDEVTV